MTKLEGRVMMITPELAKAMLQSNTMNRPLKKDQVLFYAEQMAMGKWRCNGEGIIFSDDGILLDGQHRLAAVIKSDTSQEMFVIRGVSKDYFATINTGKVRSSGDVFAIRGFKNYTNISAGVSHYLKMHKGICSGANKVICRISNDDILAEYEKHQELFIRIDNFAARCYNKLRMITRANIASYIAFLIIDKHHPEDRVLSFFTQLFNITPIDNQSVHCLREKLVRNMSGQYKMSPSYREAIIRKAWNDYISGNEHKQLRWNPQIETMPDFL